MAPTRSKKRKSIESATSVDVQTFPAPPQVVPTKTRSPTKTPNRSPIKKVRMGITVGQKQALIDNLQLESIYTSFLEIKTHADGHNSYGTRQKTTSTIYAASTRSTIAY